MSSKSKSLNTKKLKVIKILDEETVKKYLPQEEVRVIPKVWELPTRKTFFNWVLENYKTYTDMKPKESTTKPVRLDLFPQQKLVRDFMSDQSPYRGILLYHGLGVGKTCASIAISRTITDPDKEVWVFSKASLEGNYIKGIKECGMDIVRNQNHWVFIECESEIEKDLAMKKYMIPKEVINENGGAFIINYSENDSPNYNDLTSREQAKLDYQINYILNKRFKFKHLDDTRLLQKLEGIGKFPFDNKVLIFDEVHNLINGIATNSKTGVAFEKHLMAAKNCKIIFLTGTPLVNDVFESAKIFNILRGPITTYTFRLVDYAEDINWNLIKSTLKRNIYVDQIILKKSQKMVSITQNPDNYINHPDGLGVVYQKGKVLSPDRFDDLVKKQITGLGYKVISSKEVNTALPNTQKEFDALFYNRDMNKLKKTDVIKKRIMGMLSFYDPPVQSLMPEVTKIEKVFVEMSDLQAKQYQKARNEEIEKNKKMKKKIGRDMDKIKSSYRIFSRMACTFAFPEELGSPYEDAAEILNEIDEAEEEMEEAPEIDFDNMNEENEKNMAKFDMIVKKKYLKKLDKDKTKYLGIENGSLARHSPKYLKMVQKIKESPGCVFVYSQFITLIGLNTFCLSLEATGEYVEFDIRKEDGHWVLNNLPEDDNKWKYVTWAGDKEKEKREILIKVFNGELDLLPSSCQILKKQLKQKYGDEMNKHGDVIRVFMTTKTGAEGISLFNVRQVHIMEPYWQPVLIDQVIGRAVRTGSHLTLPPEERNVEVYVYLASYSPHQIRIMNEPNLRGDVARFNDGLQKRGQIVTSDESLYIISERKKNVIDAFLKLVKEVAFDCNIHASLNFNPNKPFKCLDYDSKNRDEYLSAPSIMDTVGLAEEHQEQNIKIAMGEFSVKGVKYYYELNVPPGHKKLFYTSSVLGAGRAKPVGELIIKEGKTFPAFYKKKSKSKSKNKSKSKSKDDVKKIEKKKSMKKYQSKGGSSYSKNKSKKLKKNN